MKNYGIKALCTAVVLVGMMSLGFGVQRHSIPAAEAARENTIVVAETNRNNLSPVHAQQQSLSVVAPLAHEVKTSEVNQDPSPVADSLGSHALAEILAPTQQPPSMTSTSHSLPIHMPDTASPTSRSQEEPSFFQRVKKVAKERWSAFTGKFSSSDKGSTSSGFTVAVRQEASDKESFVSKKIEYMNNTRSSLEADTRALADDLKNKYGIDVNSREVQGEMQRLIGDRKKFSLGEQYELARGFVTFINKRSPLGAVDARSGAVTAYVYKYLDRYENQPAGKSLAAGTASRTLTKLGRALTLPSFNTVKKEEKALDVANQEVAHYEMKALEQSKKLNEAGNKAFEVLKSLAGALTERRQNLNDAEQRNLGTDEAQQAFNEAQQAFNEAQQAFEDAQQAFSTNKKKYANSLSSSELESLLRTPLKLAEAQNNQRNAEARLGLVKRAAGIQDVNSDFATGTGDALRKAGSDAKTFYQGAQTKASESYESLKKAAGAKLSATGKWIGDTATAAAGGIAAGAAAAWDGAKDAAAAAIILKNKTRAKVERAGVPVLRERRNTAMQTVYGNKITAKDVDLDAFARAWGNAESENERAHVRQEFGIGEHVGTNDITRLADAQNALRKEQPVKQFVNNAVGYVTEKTSSAGGAAKTFVTDTVPTSLKTTGRYVKNVAVRSAVAVKEALKSKTFEEKKADLEEKKKELEQRKQGLEGNRQDVKALDVLANDNLILQQAKIALLLEERKDLDAEIEWREYLQMKSGDSGNVSIRKEAWRQTRHLFGEDRFKNMQVNKDGDVLAQLGQLKKTNSKELVVAYKNFSDASKKRQNAALDRFNAALENMPKADSLHLASSVTAAKPQRDELNAAARNLVAVTNATGNQDRSWLERVRDALSRGVTSDHTLKDQAEEIAKKAKEMPVQPKDGQGDEEVEKNKEAEAEVE